MPAVRLTRGDIGRAVSVGLRDPHGADLRRNRCRRAIPAMDPR